MLVFRYQVGVNIIVSLANDYKKQAFITKLQKKFIFVNWNEVQKANILQHN